MQSKVRKIISGGQTGADRAALDAAMSLGIETGGYVPKGRLAEDGAVPAEYKNLIETETADNGERTRLNILNSDATLIITHGGASPGTRLTEAAACESGKPVLVIDLDEISFYEAVSETVSWLQRHDPKILNVAGPRASEEPNIYQAAFTLLRKILKQNYPLSPFH